MLLVRCLGLRVRVNYIERLAQVPFVVIDAQDNVTHATTSKLLANDCAVRSGGRLFGTVMGEVVEFPVHDIVHIPEGRFP